LTVILLGVGSPHVVFFSILITFTCFVTKRTDMFAGRVKVMPSPGTRNMKVTGTKKLVTGFDDGCVASVHADGDISVVVRKQVTQTNTLGV
jgi:hypothetical protein